MKESFTDQRFRPEFHNPVFIEGLPGFGNVGKVTADLLIKFSKAKLFAEYYSPFFPDYVTTNTKGICFPPNYKFFASSSGDYELVILTGDLQPPLNNVVAHYKICEELLDFAQNLGCNLVVTIGGIPVPSDKGDVYVSATSRKLAEEAVDQGGIIYGKGRIMGATGLLLGLAREKKMEGICILGATSGLGSDKDAGSGAFQMLLKILKKRSDGRKSTEEKLIL